MSAFWRQHSKHRELYVATRRLWPAPHGAGPRPRGRGAFSVRDANSKVFWTGCFGDHSNTRRRHTDSLLPLSPLAHERLDWIAKALLIDRAYLRSVLPEQNLELFWTTSSTTLPCLSADRRSHPAARCMYAQTLFTPTQQREAVATIADSLARLVPLHFHAQSPPPPSMKSLLQGGTLRTMNLLLPGTYVGARSDRLRVGRRQREHGCQRARRLARGRIDHARRRGHGHLFWLLRSGSPALARANSILHLREREIGPLGA